MKLSPYTSSWRIWSDRAFPKSALVLPYFLCRPSMTSPTPRVPISCGRPPASCCATAPFHFRYLSRISIRPRIYQFVPMLMGLRLDPVRLLIAADVGVGKTIEALLMAREMLDRGEIKRLCVLCPPYLCDQWQKELAEKFNLEAEIIRSGTVGQLERRKPGNESIYKYYPIQVAIIDFL